MNITSKPLVYLLCGLPGSGKTTYAKQLENEGVVRFSLDEELFKTWGHNFPSEKYQEFETQTKKFLLAKTLECLDARKSVVLDWGFWRREERQQIRKTIADHGGIPKLVYFMKITEELKANIKDRDKTINHHISEEMLEGFAEKFEEPGADEDAAIFST